MELKEAIEILKRHNEWRRGSDKYPLDNPTRIGIAIDTILEALNNEIRE